LKLTPARFIVQYNALGVRFVIQGGEVVPVGDGVSPVFAEWVAQNGEWLKPGLPVQCRRDQVVPPSVTVESSHADRLVWDGIVNARRNEAKRAAIVKGNRYK